MSRVSQRDHRFLSNHLKNIKFQIIRLRYVPEYGVVRGLLTGFYLFKLHASVAGGGTEHFRKKLLGHEVTAGSGGEIAAPGRSFSAL